MSSSKLDKVFSVQGKLESCEQRKSQDEKSVYFQCRIIEAAESSYDHPTRWDFTSEQSLTSMVGKVVKASLAVIPTYRNHKGQSFTNYRLRFAGNPA